MCLRVSPCVSRGLLILRFRKHSVDDRALRSTLSHACHAHRVARRALHGVHASDDSAARALHREDASALDRRYVVICGTDSPRRRRQ